MRYFDIKERNKKILEIAKAITDKRTRKPTLNAIVEWLRKHEQEYGGLSNRQIERIIYKY